MKNPLVSVIIPCHNYAQYVGRAIESVKNQTYKNIQLIVIDDGSTDESVSAVEREQNRFDFEFYKQENKGIVLTRNRGVKLAKGEYLLQLDSDDWLEPTYIEETLKAAVDNKAEIVYTQAKIIGRVEFVTEAPEYNLEYLKHDGYMNASALVHKSIFKNRQYDEYLNDKGNEDWALYLDACLDGAKAFLVNKPLLNYRKHTDRKSRADRFEGTKKELLVRHHVLSTQNHKHPKEMWYFSPYINIIKKYLDEGLDSERLQKELNEVSLRYNRFWSVRVKRSIKRVVKKLLHPISTR